MPDLTPTELTTLARYFAGQCSAVESAHISQWIAADAGRQAHVNALRAEWTVSGFLLDAKQVDMLWQRLEGQVLAPVPAAQSRRVGAVWRIAAGVALVAGAAGLWWSVGDRRLARSEAAATVPAPRVITTLRGQRAQFQLPDGTHVTLGPASTLRYVVAADRGPRTLSLEGSAYFVVTHDAERPFVVRTSYGIAKDLGTRFAIQAYATDSIVDVVVAEGKVSLSATRDTLAPVANDLILAPGDRGRATARGRTTIERGLAVDRYLAWTEGRLEFENTPLADAVVQIGRWYDLDVRLADRALGQRQLSASFRNESAAEVLRLIAASAGVDVEQYGKLVTLRAHGR